MVLRLAPLLLLALVNRAHAQEPTPLPPVPPPPAQSPPPPQTYPEGPAPSPKAPPPPAQPVLVAPVAAPTPPPAPASPPPRTDGVAGAFSLASAFAGGRRLSPTPLEERLWEFGLRLDVLFSRRDVRSRWALGPAFDFRTVDLDTADLGAGVQFLLRFGEMGAFWVTGIVGKTVTPDALESTFVAGTIAIGGRKDRRATCGGPACVRYEPRIGIYGSLRRGLFDPNIFEFTIGLEVDISVLLLFGALLANAG